MLSLEAASKRASTPPGPSVAATDRWWPAPAELVRPVHRIVAQSPSSRALAATRGRGKAVPNAAIAGECAQGGGGIGVRPDRDSHHDVQDAVATGSNDLGEHVGGVARMSTRATMYPCCGI